MRIATTCYNLSAKLIRYRLRIIEGIERNAIRKIDRRYRKGANHAA
jgi:repressor of nif and glnA expression